MITCIWLIIALLFLLLELSAPGLFYFLSFSFGALIGAVTNYNGFHLAIQCMVFLASTIIAFGILNYFMRRYPGTTHKTNIDAMVGQKGIVIKAIDKNTPGQVKIGGQIWSARSNMELVVDTTVGVKGVKGCHLTVRKD